MIESELLDHVWYCETHMKPLQHVKGGRAKCPEGGQICKASWTTREKEE